MFAEINTGEYETQNMNILLKSFQKTRFFYVHISNIHINLLHNTHFCTQ